MSARGPTARNNYLEEGMALLIRNRADSENDQERLELKEWQHQDRGIARQG
jgi:hypothetical protein